MAQPQRSATRADVVSSGSGARRGRFPGWLAMVVAAAALIGLARITSTEPAPTPQTPAPRPSPRAITTPAVDQQQHGLPLGDVTGVVLDVRLAGGAMFFVETPPTRLVRMSPDGRIEAVHAAPVNADRVAVDIFRNMVWVWTSSRPSTIARAYDARTLRPLGRSRIPEETFGGAAYGGRLWLGAAVDFIRLAPGGRPQRIVSANYVFDAAADPARRRVLAALGDAVAGYDARTLQLVARQPLTLSKPSLAVVGDSVWVGGFSDSGRKVLRLDARTLRPAPRRDQPDVGVGPGAIVWPGARTVFVRDGGSEELTCVDGDTGATLARWEGIMGPVAAQNGKAFAVVGQGLVPLLLGPRCAG